jgi:hypothetical protein
MHSAAMSATRARSLHLYDRVFQGVRSVSTGLFLLAGNDELAEPSPPLASPSPAVVTRDVESTGMDVTPSRSASRDENASGVFRSANRDERRAHASPGWSAVLEPGPSGRLRDLRRPFSAPDVQRHGSMGASFRSREEAWP